MMAVVGLGIWLAGRGSTSLATIALSLSMLLKFAQGRLELRERLLGGVGVGG